ncbi:MAG: hypothetical protein IAF08_16170 [Rhizobacter sp.]|nr:hypothetical protein [Chlorobiales bacterium]
MTLKRNLIGLFLPLIFSAGCYTTLADTRPPEPTPVPANDPPVAEPTAVRPPENPKYGYDQQPAQAAPQSEQVYDEPNYDATYQTFYDDLAPDGEWFTYPSYGYVWRPRVAAGWRPYTNGRWVLTNYGWTWVANERWGWAPFHYGRWFHDDFYGWVWRPDTVWGPAWVSWRQADDYYGWAPLPPNVNISGRYRGSGYRYRDNDWVFVQNVYITNVNVTRYVVPTTRNREIVVRTREITDIQPRGRSVYAGGPIVADVERQTNTRVATVRLRDTDRPATTRDGGSEVTVYRPQMREAESARPAATVSAPAPSPDATTRQRPNMPEVSPVRPTEPASTGRPIERPTDARPAGSNPVDRPAEVRPGATAPATRPVETRPAQPQPAQPEARPAPPATTRPAARPTQTRPAPQRKAAKPAQPAPREERKSEGSKSRDNTGNEGRRGR